MGNVPKLRFSEFSGAWKKTELGSLGAFMKGSAIGKKDLTKNGEPCILYGELYTKYGETVKEVESKTKCTTNNMLRSKYGDVLIPSSGETASDIATCTCVLVDNVLIGGDINLFRGFFVNGIFFSYALNHKRNGEIAKLAQGASVVHIYSKQLEKILMPTPTMPEQTKIADFLTLIDKNITKQDEKVAALEQYKKGLMQKIFSRKIRFKDDNGKDYLEWEEKLFGDMFRYYPTYSYSRAMLSDTGSIKYIHYGDIHTKYPIMFDVQNTKIPYLNNTTPTKDIDSSSYCKEGDLIIADASEDYEAIGKATVLINIGNDKIISGLHTILARDEQNQIVNSFRGYLFASEGVKKQIRFAAVGAKVLGISKSNLAYIIINLPSLPEQTKIANFLSLYDRKIEKEKAKLEALRAQKKGLLQQMFV